MTKEAEDATLIAAAAAGDRAAFARLMTTSLPRAYRTAYRLLGNAAEAEDIAQEAMLRVWRHAEKFNPARAAYATWLYQITTNLALDRLRAARPHQDLDAAAEIAEPGDGAETTLIAAQNRAAVAAALAQLPDRARAAVVLVHYEGLAGKDAAAILAVTPKALESLLYRALKTLRGILSEPDKPHQRMLH